MSLKLFLGCMYAGKTTELYREYYINNKIKSVVCINYSKDIRYGDDDFTYTHDNKKIPSIKTEKLMDINPDILENISIILINEGQFFTDIVEFCTLYCDQKNKDIVVAALDGDFLRKPFGEIPKLISMADEIVKLKAKCVGCNDGTNAIFTRRLGNNKEQFLIGTDIYQPVCRACYNKN